MKSERRMRRGDEMIRHVLEKGREWDGTRAEGTKKERDRERERGRDGGGRG